MERNEYDRSTFMLDMLDYPAEFLVSVDESAFNRNTTMRDYVYAPVGQRARRREYFVQDTMCVIASWYQTFQTDMTLRQDVHSPCYQSRRDRQSQCH